MITKHLFILNPAAGVKNCVEEMRGKIEKAIADRQDRDDEVFEIVETAGVGDATRLARIAAADNPGFTRVYACGGDGTLNEVVNGAVGAENVAVCPIPVGSGNDFVKYFEDLSPEDFLDPENAMAGDVIAADVLKIGEHFSLNIASVGLDAITAKRQVACKKIPFVSGPAAYKIALGYSFLSNMKNKIRFEIDGKKVEIGKGNVTLAVAGNGRWYGGGFKATPYADIQDGLIDFIVVPTISRMEFLKYVSDYKKGEHVKTMPFLYHTRCRKVQMYSEKKICIQSDGEIFEVQNPVIEIVPGALNLIVPRKK